MGYEVNSSEWTNSGSWEILNGALQLVPANLLSGLVQVDLQIALLGPSILSQPTRPHRPSCYDSRLAYTKFSTLCTLIWLF